MTEPLFILAPPRSFTTVTSAMIGQHPEMYGLPETNLFVADTYQQLSKFYRVFRPRFGHGLLRAVAELGLGEQTEGNVELAKAWLEEHATVSTADLFRDLAQWAAPRRLVDKSPAFVFRLQNLERLHDGFPEASYLHLVRHPRGNCDSVAKISSEVGSREEGAVEQGHRVRKGPGQIMAAGQPHPENIWMKPHRRVLQFLEQIPAERQLRLRGEDLLSEPDRWLRAIAVWLGISTDHDALDAMKHPELSPFACHGPRNARIGNDPSFLENPALRPYRAKPMSLDDPMEWNPDITFSTEIKDTAELFGYVG